MSSTARRFMSLFTSIWTWVLGLPSSTPQWVDFIDDVFWDSKSPSALKKVRALGGCGALKGYRSHAHQTRNFSIKRHMEGDAVHQVLSGVHGQCTHSRSVQTKGDST